MKADHVDSRDTVDVERIACVDSSRVVSMWSIYC